MYLGPVEQEINLLERKTGGFGVEKVDEPNEEKVEDGEVDVGEAANVLNGDWCNFDCASVRVPGYALGRIGRLTNDKVEEPKR